MTEPTAKSGGTTWCKLGRKRGSKSGKVQPGRKMRRNTAVFPLALIRMIKTNGEIIVIS